MNAKLKIPFALRDGRLIHISEVESGGGHGGICPACESPLIARKGMKMRHHFAHRPEATCNPETALHRTAKLLLCEGIEHALAEQREVKVSWECSRCGSGHSGNLLKKARSVRVEHSFATCRPDLTLFDENARPVAIVEVVVSHAPEDHVRDFCKQEKIGLLEYHLTDDSSLDALRPLTKFHAKVGSVCTRKKCPRCMAPTHSIRLFIGEGKCWKCRSKMKMALIARRRRIAGPDEFNDTAIAIAHQRGAILRRCPPNDAGRRLLRNSCPRCRSLTGAFFLIDYGYLACGKNSVLVGSECSRCDWEKQAL